MERTAIDGSGHLGSFYDGYSDCIVGQINMDDKRKVFYMEDPIKCEIKHDNANQSQNLLHIAGIEDNLQLSILLNLAPRTRTASIVNHPYPINAYTRFICVSYEYRKDQLPDNAKDIQKSIGNLKPQTTATHMITSISYGIAAVVVLQLSTDTVIIQKIDHALKRVQDILKGTSNEFSITSEDEDLFRKNTTVTVYSNISPLNATTSIRDICQFINSRNGDDPRFRPITYTLHPIQLFYPQFTGSGSPFIQIHLTYNNKLVQYLLEYMNVLQDLKYSLDHIVRSLLCGHLEERLCELQQQWINLKNMQENTRKRLQKLVNDIRRGRSDASMIGSALEHEDRTIFHDSSNKMTKYLNELEEKGQLITDLRQNRFQYCNVMERGIDLNDDETTMEHKLVSNDQNTRALCSNDTLNKNQPKQFHKLRDDLIKNHKKHSEMRLIYADFSYSSFQLTKMILLPSNTHKQVENKSKHTETASSIEMPNSDMINILLLGETGVGKSTFINALGNYLTFDTLQQAETGHPVVLIPVSFLITVGVNFEERIVKFGDVDGLKNEDFNDHGQSVTQHCKSYEFDLKHTNDKKILRIIDTPGFGDTRGVDQDDRNMQHILEYISNLTHINAICFLLKPNESRLNIFFRSCAIQLLSILGQNIGENIIFCFTNSRQTFYTPGDTAPVLKQMLNSLPKNDVTFKNENVFCFDNESFRYLVALQNKIQFDDAEKPEYEKSWTTSVTQSNRFINYIQTKLPAYRIDGNLQSIKHAQLEIVHMIRPMLETMRNILRNRIIDTMSQSNGLFALHPKKISRPASICTACPPYPLQVDNFWVAHNIPHEIGNTCNRCQCSLDQHHPIDYLLDYKFLKKSSKEDETQMSELQRQLCEASVVFAYFLTNVDIYSQNDPFLVGLVQMITEEKYLSENQKPNDFNLILVDYLIDLQKEYDYQMRTIVKNHEQSRLSDIYQLINTIREYPMVREQMAAVKEGQKMIRKQFEDEVQKNLTNGLVSKEGSS